jgi:hypothetical protein
LRLPKTHLLCRDLTIANERNALASGFSSLMRRVTGWVWRAPSTAARRA